MWVCVRVWSRKVFMCLHSQSPSGSTGKVYFSLTWKSELRAGWKVVVLPDELRLSCSDALDDVVCLGVLEVYHVCITVPRWGKGKSSSFQGCGLGVANTCSSTHNMWSGQNLVTWSYQLQGELRRVLPERNKQNPEVESMAKKERENGYWDG